MPTDLTGTPTALGIGTYNVDVDAPSGLGFNAAMAQIDAIIQAIMPAGTVLPYAGSAAPSGFLLADGSAVSRTTYSTLFGVIGTAYGAGDGTTTFNLPDLRGRVAVGKNAATFATLGATGGAETVTLDATQIPSHTHTGTTSSDSAGTPAGSLSSDSAGTPAGSISSVSAGTPAGSVSVAANGAHTHTVSGDAEQSVGGSGAGVGYSNGWTHIASITLGGTDSQGSHTHTATFTGSALGTHNHTFTGSALAGHTHTFTGSALAGHAHTFTTAATGGGLSHTNLQPYQVFNHIIKH